MRSATEAAGRDTGARAVAPPDGARDECGVPSLTGVLKLLVFGESLVQIFMEFKPAFVENGAVGTERTNRIDLV